MACRDGVGNSVFPNMHLLFRRMPCLAMVFCWLVRPAGVKQGQQSAARYPFLPRARVHGHAY